MNLPVVVASAQPQLLTLHKLKCHVAHLTLTSLPAQSSQDLEHDHCIALMPFHHVQMPWLGHKVINWVSASAESAHRTLRTRHVAIALLPQCLLVGTT